MSDPDNEDYEDLDDILTDLDDPDDLKLDEEDDEDSEDDDDEPDYADPDSDADEDEDAHGERIDAPAHIPGRGGHPYALDDIGTPAEERAGHSLDERLASEEPDVFEEEEPERLEDSADPTYVTLDPPDADRDRETGAEGSAVHIHPDTDDIGQDS